MTEQKIPFKPGIYKGIPYEVYAQIDAVSASKLKTIHTQSPLALNRRADIDNDALRQDRAGHAAVFEPDLFDSEFVVWPSTNPDTGKKATRRGSRWDDFEALHADRTILTESQHRASSQLSGAVRNHPVAGDLVKQDGKAEVTILWRDVRTGAMIKARIDWLCEATVELKTTRDPAPRRFASQSADLGYHLQYALYADAVATVIEEPLPFLVIAAQNAEPFDVVVYSVSDEVLNTGKIGRAHV